MSESQDLTWTRTKPTDAGYYWVKTEGYMRGIIVWVFVGGDGDLVVGRPLRRRVDAIEGWWAGPLPEPEPSPLPLEATDNA